VQLRRGQVRTPLLILGYTPPMYAENMVYLDITQEVHSLEYARQLNDALNGTNFLLNVHLKLDTGMTRIGFSVCDGQAMEEVLQAAQLPHLHVEGVFMHFSVADSREAADVAYTRLQHQRFMEALNQLRAAGIEPELRHCCNSGGTLLYPEYAMDMVRPGILTYGVCPSDQTTDILPLQPVLSLSTTVSQIRDIPAGTDVSYGRLYTTPCTTRMGVLPYGYADGFQRCLSGKCELVTDHGKAPQRGRICMDMCMIDLTELPQVDVGDEVEVFGKRNRVDDLAALAGTIPYELTCAVSKRVPRIYFRGGQEVSRELLLRF